MAATFKPLDKCTGCITTYGDSRLKEKLKEWKEHHNDTRQYQGRTQSVAATQRRGTAANNCQ